MQEDARGYGEALWGEMAKLGWLGLPFPEQYGGAGLGLVELALLHEEMGRVAYPGPFLATVVLGGLPLLLGGSAAQKEKWLPAIASGRARVTAALQEESLDWDPASVAATAARAGAGWTISGVKRFVPWAQAADAVLVPARTPEGVSLFLVDPKAAGVTLRPTTGMDLTTRWSELTLGGVAVGADALVGPAGGGGPAPGLGAPPRRRLRLRGDAGRRAPLPRHGRRLRQGARAVRAAHRHLPGHPAQVRGDAHGGGE